MTDVPGPVFWSDAVRAWRGVVAAVAGFVWTLNPTYLPEDVRDQIRMTVRQHCVWNGGMTCTEVPRLVSTGGILDAAAAVGANCEE